MPDLSVIIPSRAEPWLLQTINSIRAAVRGDTEIIVVLDGPEAEPKLPEDFGSGPVVRVLRNIEPVGQRQSCNQGVRVSAARFILKTDAHSLMADGFDVTLIQNCAYDWTVIPRMYNLHSHDEVCQHCGERYYNRPHLTRCEKCGCENDAKHAWMIREMVWKPNKRKGPIDWMWIRSPDAKEMPLRVQYWDAPTARDFPFEYQAFKKWAARQGDIADVMTGQGACWLMHRERYWELGGLDEGHGGWGQMGVEIAMKSWLSGGRQVVNRRTWFAHLFRCGASEGCCWPMSGKEQQKAREYSIKLWTGGTWPLQQRPLSWLVEKFSPLPTWTRPETITALPIVPPPVPPHETSNPPSPSIPAVDAKDDLTVIYYTDDSLPTNFAAMVRLQLQEAAGCFAGHHMPIVEQHQPADWPRNHESIYRQILAGLEKVKTPFVALAEHDVLYPEGYFEHRPTHDVEYNTNRWVLHADRVTFSRRTGLAMSQLFARTAWLQREIAERLHHPACLAEHGECFEPGVQNLELGLPESVAATFKNAVPTIDISGHGHNLTGPKGVRGKMRPRVKPWGTIAEIMERFKVPRPGDKASAPVPAIPMTGPTVSVLIPARNEFYLEKTVADLLEHLCLDFEILIGWDGDPQAYPMPTFADPRVRTIVSQERIGMRPMINRLAREARGEFLLRMDAHCSVAPGIDEELVGVCRREGHVGVVAMRYELSPRTWTRRRKTDIPYRRLSHVSEDGRGLRSLPWPEWAAAHADEVVGETMSCSGSSWTCRRATFVDLWGGFDERHGTFGQEGAEIACMFWLSGGRFLVHKGTWYAHHNRGKASYTLGAHEKKRSIARSHELWVNNQWPHAKFDFQWLIEKFHPPGWPTAPLSEGIPAPRQRCLVKAHKRLRVQDLWREREAIADPGKRHRLTVFWQVFEQFIRGTLHDRESTAGYHSYLVSHLSRRPVTNPTQAQLRKVEKAMLSATRLVADIAQRGLTAPLEFYAEDGRMILWKGYRRLVIAHVLGIEKVVGRCYADRTAAGVLSPQANLTRLEPPPVTTLHDLAAEQFRQWGNGATDKYFTHNYIPYYDAYLQPIRKRAKRILELGLLNGASLALWRQYFPRAEIVGVDIDPDRWKKFAAELPNTRVMIGNEADTEFLSQVARRGPYDLIVDDASHDPLLQRTAFEALWPAVRQYGYYVMEDTFRGYDGAESDKPPGLPPGIEENIYCARDVRAIHHHYNISFVQKA